MSENDLPCLQIDVPVLNVADGGCSASRVEQIVDNDPIAKLAEITLLRGLLQEDLQLPVRVGFLDSILLLQVRDNHIRQALPLAPPQKGIRDPQISGNRIVRQPRPPHRNHHLLQVPFGQSVHRHLNVDVMGNGLQMIVVVPDRCFRHASGCLGNDKGFPYFFQRCARVFIHVDFTLQNRPLPFTEKWEKGSGVAVFRENQDFNFFGRKPPKTKRKKPRIRRFKAFGAARQIRTADLILTKDALYRLSYSSKWRRGRDLNPRPPA